MAISFVLNGELVTVGAFDPNTTLLEFLRQRGLTGTKESCAEGECGACAVVLTRPAQTGSRYHAVHACLTLLAAVADHEVRSVEGVASGGVLHPVQAALVEHGASQCGYCTPGFVMSLFAEYYRPGRSEVDLAAIDGNLCRCTGYRPIRDAARSLPVVRNVEAHDAHVRRLCEPAPPIGSFVHEHAGRAVLRPTSLAELREMWRDHPDAKVIAGGTDTVVEMNQQYRRFEAILLIDQIPELARIEEGESALTIGAGVRLAEIERVLVGRLRAFDGLWGVFGSRLVRERATLGGNIATASPIGDSSPVLLALDAELELESEQGRRRVPLNEFFTGYRKTALAPRELIGRVHIPKPLPSVTRFYKVAKRVSDDISSVSVAAALTFDGDRVRQARLAFGGVAETPRRLPSVEAALNGQAWTRATQDAACAQLDAAITPISDVRASADYRRQAARACLARLFDTVQPSTPDGAS
jgi:xanthine dehydrogenase small subunit